MIKNELLELEKNASFREIRPLPEGCLNLSSNDYLGIAKDVQIRKDFLKSYEGPISNPSSRLLSNAREFDALERKLEKHLGCERALLFNSGYHANVGIYSTFLGQGDVVFCDRLNHASIIDGIKLGGGKIVPFKHLDYEDLHKKLQKYRKNFKRAIISTETLFSMDGDFADIERLKKLRDEFDCLLFVDEAHSFGVFPSVQGADLVMGTLGKAIGSYGAFCAGNEEFVSYLVNFARPFIFSTTFPPLCAAFSSYVLDLDLVPRREKLLSLGKSVCKDLGLSGEGYIVPFVVGENEHAVALSDGLIKNGYYVLPIRYPTVAKGAARVRLSLSADMELEDLKKCVEILLAYRTAP